MCALKGEAIQKGETVGLCPTPHQGVEHPGPTIADVAWRVKTALFPQLLGETAEVRLDAIVLLARRLSAAKPDAKHPGKQERKAGK